MTISSCSTFILCRIPFMSIHYPHLNVVTLGTRSLMDPSISLCHIDSWDMIGRLHYSRTPRYVGDRDLVTGQFKPVW